MKKVRWGVMGAGGIADRSTIPGMLKAENAELVAVMGPDIQRTEAIRAKYNAKRAYTSAAEITSDVEIDALYIASPVIYHADQAMMAADKGKHVLIEKPIAMTAAEGQAVAEYCRKRGVLAAAGFMMRFGSYAMAMKQAIANGKIGRLVSAYAQFTCWYPDIEGSWRQSRSRSGGGALMDMGVHCIDLIQHISGCKVVEVAGFNDTLSFKYEVEDSSCVMLKLENGALCSVQSNFNIPDEAAKWRLEFFGDRGRLLGDSILGQIDGGSLDAVFIENVGGYDAQQGLRSASRSEIIDVELGNMYTREIESFGNSILSGAATEVPLEDAIYVQRVVEAAYLSNDEKRIIKI